LLRLTSLNLNGIRSAARKGLQAWVQEAAPDCICVQELRAQAAELADGLEALAGLRGHFYCAEKKGYAGVGIYSRHEPSEVRSGIGVPEFDAEGRWIELRFDRPGRRFSVISGYFPSGSSGPERQLAKFRFLEAIGPHLQALRAEREFVLCSDVNIAHQEIDLKNWKGNLKNSGFLPEERAWMTQLLGRELGQGGLVDVYRHLHPSEGPAAYTWWSNRGQAWANNVGWRIDYHLATPALAALAREASVYKAQRFSDHAPLSIAYDFGL